MASQELSVLAPKQRVRAQRTVEVRDAEARNVTSLIFKGKDPIQADGDADASEKVFKAGPYASGGLIDPFSNLSNVLIGGTTAVSLIQPEYNPYEVVKLPDRCSILKQCIESMAVNIGGFGHRLEYIGPADQEDSKGSLAEKQRLTDFLSQPNGEYSFPELRSRLRRDRETFGYSFMEIVRGTDENIAAIFHIPAQTMRMTTVYPDDVPVEKVIYRNGKAVRYKTTKKFRRFVQVQGTSTVYFKEFGDPRIISSKDGKEMTEGSGADPATEIFHVSRYSPGSQYGLPCWINQLPSILGLRESELTNLQFFKDNAVPAMVVLVSGGALTATSISQIQEHFTSGRGRESMNRVLVLEASGDEDAGTTDSAIPSPKLDIKPLSSERQTDGMFLEYEKEAARKIRSSFRLPAIMVGNTDDYTRATADTSLVMADTQVFGPERASEDDLFNTHILPVDSRPLEFWTLRTNPPRLVSPSDVMKAIQQLDDAGGLTPNIAISIANELFDLKLTPIDEAWGDYPFEIVVTLAQTGNLSGIEEIVKELDTNDNGTTEGQLDEPKTKPVKTKPKTAPNNNKEPNNSVSPSAKATREMITDRFKKLSMASGDTVRRRYRKPKAEW